LTTIGSTPVLVQNKVGLRHVVAAPLADDHERIIVLIAIGQDHLHTAADTIRAVIMVAAVPHPPPQILLPDSSARAHFIIFV
jgi:hypothetical protein